MAASFFCRDEIPLRTKVEIPPTAVGGWFRSFPQDGSFSLLRRATREASHGHAPSREDLNYPPTSVGGIDRLDIQSITHSTKNLLTSSVH